MKGIGTRPGGPPSRTQDPVSPFLRRGPDTRAMMLALLGCLSLGAFAYALRYDGSFALRFVAFLLLGGACDLLYTLLRDGRLALPRFSVFVTTALLVCSVPAHMPWWQVTAGLLVALWFAKRMADPAGLRLNPMLVGRLFLMIVFADSIQVWLAPGASIDTLTAATPLYLLAAEGVAYAPGDLLLGSIQGTWEGVYTILPGSPGEVMPLLVLLCGVGLYAYGALDWRPGATYLLGMVLACLALGMPPVFHLLAGSTVFTAVYIVSDPRSMPGSRSGRLIAGLLAGLLNGAIRHHGYYPEGVVLAVLAVNLLAPTLDRLAFYLRGMVLARRRSRAQAQLR